MINTLIKEVNIRKFFSMSFTPVFTHVYIPYSSGEHTYFYQLFMEKDDKLLLPTTQKLVELSFLQGNVKLKEVRLNHYLKSLEYFCDMDLKLFKPD